MQKESSPRRDATVRIKGMHCATCTDTVRESLLGLKGVEEARVNLATEKATFVYDPSRVSMKDVENAVKEAGYEVAKDEITLTIGGMHCATCAITIQDSLSEVPGVRDARVNFALGKAIVDYDTAVATEAELRKAVEDAGYKVLEVQGVMAEQLARKKELREAYRALMTAALFTIPLAAISMTYDLWPEGLLDMSVRNYILLMLRHLSSSMRASGTTGAPTGPSRTDAPTWTRSW